MDSLLKPTPDFFAKYIAQTLSRGWPENRRGRPRHVARDTLINHAVNDVLRTFDVKATRNRATQAPCACSIVKEALALEGFSMSEANVEVAYTAGAYPVT
jgi:hypothetical protein